MSDPLAELLRGERGALLKAAPPPNAARLWHEARRRRAASLRRSLRTAGWLVRLAVAAATLAGFLFVRSEAHFLLLLCLLCLWLTRGACAAVHREPGKGILK